MSNQDAVEQRLREIRARGTRLSAWMEEPVAGQVEAMRPQMDANLDTIAAMTGEFVAALLREDAGSAAVFRAQIEASVEGADASMRSIMAQMLDLIERGIAAK